MPKKYGVFISYSHEDSKHVGPIIQLITAMRKDLVFQDTRNIVPGKMWEPQLMEALQEAKIIIIFWCAHAAKSEYVKKEYEMAIESKKDILPLLLDDSQLTASLASYQWIDFRSTHIHGINSLDPAQMEKVSFTPQSTGMIQSSATGSSLSFWLIAGLLIAAVILLYLFFSQQVFISILLNSLYVVLALAGILLLTMGMYWLVTKVKYYRKRDERSMRVAVGRPIEIPALAKKSYSNIDSTLQNKDQRFDEFVIATGILKKLNEKFPLSDDQES